MSREVLYAAAALNCTSCLAGMPGSIAVGKIFFPFDFSFWYLNNQKISPFLMQIFRTFNFVGMQGANIESSLVLDTSCLAEQICELSYRQFLFEKCPKPMNI